MCLARKTLVGGEDTAKQEGQKCIFFKRVQRSGWSLDGARRPFMKIKMGVVQYIFVLKAQNESVNTSFIT